MARISLLRSDKVASSKYVGISTMHLSYVIGFQNRKMAASVADLLQKDPKITLTPSSINNEEQMKATDIGMPDMAISFLNMDTRAELVVPKKDKNSDCDVKYMLSDMDIDTFYTLPFERNIGVIVPFEQISESDECLVFASTVIDPVQDIQKFASSLEVY